MNVNYSVGKRKRLTFLTSITVKLMKSSNAVVLYQSIQSKICKVISKTKLKFYKNPYPYNINKQNRYMVAKTRDKTYK